ncbi:MAG: hypothetical protein H6739_26505 [Alphaproteobacteria bacterium]|nr:hypothetical protein [Alphaproteobacteria bacterium]
MPLARDIDEVVAHLDALLADPAIGQTRLGLFPALYRQVTLRVREGIQEGRFEDGERMNRLDTTFANFYLDAMDAWRRGERPARSWEVSFRFASEPQGLALQHLLLGMNAHINLDLGTAAARTAPGNSIVSMQRDFDRINVLLSSMIDASQQALAEFSPSIALLDRAGHRADERLAVFSIEKARLSAWRTACVLAPLQPQTQQPVVELLDRGVRNLGRLIIHPGPAMRLAILAAQEAESDDIPALVDRLNRLDDRPTPPPKQKAERKGKKKAPKKRPD